MNIIHKLYAFGVRPEKGYHVVFVTEIENWPEPICNETITDEPYDFVYLLSHSDSTAGLKTSTYTVFTNQSSATSTQMGGWTYSWMTAGKPITSSSTRETYSILSAISIPIFPQGLCWTASVLLKKKD